MFRRSRFIPNFLYQIPINNRIRIRHNFKNRIRFRNHFKDWIWNPDPTRISTGTPELPTVPDREDPHPPRCQPHLAQQNKRNYIKVPTPRQVAAQTLVTFYVIYFSPSFHVQTRSASDALVKQIRN